MVAPFVGVWIEIIKVLSSLKNSLVAPFVGVWIEITWYRILRDRVLVAPFVGVWIEIYLKIQIDYNLKSLPLWECGLK